MKEKYCGSTLPPKYKSSGQQVSIEFATNDNIQAGGFNISYKFIEKAAGKNSYVVKPNPFTCICVTCRHVYLVNRNRFITSCQLRTAYYLKTNDHCYNDNTLSQ